MRNSSGARGRWAVMAMAAAAAAVSLVGARDARACGGCFHPPPQPNETPSTITAHRMILSISSQQTTLYDQIEYSGSPSSFAWVLPISGVAKVGLSADVVFDALDATTSVQVEPPPLNCPGPPPSNCGDVGGSLAGEGSTAADASAAPPVNVLKQETVGPYETVQLQADDPNALNDWLTSHGFQIPDDVKPIIGQYVTEHFGFLAMKLVPGASVKAMRPVRVTTAGASPVLPLRMVAAGTGATVGITLWVLGEGRYETANFPSFTIAPNELVWDFATESSNYAQLRAQKETAGGGAVWQVESSIAPMQQRIVATIMGGLGGAGQPASSDYDPVPASDAGAGETADQVRQDDLNTLFAGIAPGALRVTRLRGDLAHSALSKDLLLRASGDQSIVSNYVQVTQSVHAPPCPTYPPPTPCPGNGPFGSGGDGGAIAMVPRSNGGGGAESFSCASAPGGSGFGEGAAAAAIAGVIALASIRGRRRRQDARK